MIDSACNDCGVMVNGSSWFILENISNTNSGPILKTNEQDKLTGDLLGKTYAVGHVHTSNNGSVEVSNGQYLEPTALGNLVDDRGHYFTKSQPQYEDWDVSSFSSVKDCGAKGMPYHSPTTPPFEIHANKAPNQATAKQTTLPPSTPPSAQTPPATKSPTSPMVSTSSQTPSTSRPTAAS